MAEHTDINESIVDSRNFENEKDPDSLLTSSLNEVFDEGEIAQINQLREMENIAHIARNLNKPEIFEGFDGLCVECGVEIPKERILLSKIRCVDCQQEQEDMQKRKMGISINQKYIPAKVNRAENWQNTEKMENIAED